MRKPAPSGCVTDVSTVHVYRIFVEGFSRRTERVSLDATLSK